APAFHEGRVMRRFVQAIAYPGNSFWPCQAYGAPMTNFPAISRLTPERIAAAILAVVSALFCLEGAHYPYMTSIGPGAGFFPVWVGGICAAMALLMVFLPARAPQEGAAPADA